MFGTSKNKFGKIEKNAKTKEGKCLFPFKYKWKTHESCFETKKGAICATEINENTRTLTKYGYCKPLSSSINMSHNKSFKKSSSLKLSSIKRVKQTKHRKTKKIRLILEDTSSLNIGTSSSKSITKRPPLSTLKKNKITNSKKKKTLKLIETEIPSLKITQDIMKKGSMEKEEVLKESNYKVYNDEFVEILEELKDIMQSKGEVFRAKAYQTAQETIMLYKGNITDPNQLKGLKGIGSTILSKLNEYVNTGKLKAIEKGRHDPIILLTKVYGVGPKKAKDLIDKGITDIESLRENKQFLNDVQQIGLNYYDDILEKIPRPEIDEYKEIFDEVIDEINKKSKGTKYEIVGSYRRGKQVSGDIDVIITNDSDNRNVFETFIDILKEREIIIELLSFGKSKSLTIAKLPGKLARRIDFLYTPMEEYPFAILYFTGSKIFNTVMRQRALQMSYTLNEHGLSHMNQGGKKGEKVSHLFSDEKSIFDFLNMKFKLPEERIDGRAVENKLESEKIEQIGEIETEAFEKETVKLKKKNITLKRKKPSITNILNQFKMEGLSALKIFSEEELSSLIQTSNDAYYCKGLPIMTDNQYDILIEYTLDAYPNNKVVKEGHTACEMEIQRNKVTLPYQMWSMDKIKPDTNALNKWTETFKGPYVISCKLDGVSGLYVTEGNIPKLYTRGNGIVGQDISHLIPYLKLPKEKGLAIRGEFIISKEVFKERFASQFSNPRNFVAGIINQKKVNPDTISSLNFVAYEVIKPEFVPYEQLNYLKELDTIEVVKYTMMDKISNGLLSETLIKWRHEYEYEIDGIICMDNKMYPRISGNPEHAFAFKMVLSEQVAEAKVMDVLWSPSKDGILKPRVRIEPIILGGVTIEFATGFNAKFIEENRIGLGAIIQIVRSGDVIPHILSITTPADKGLMPNIPYVWNENHVDIILVNKEDNIVVKEKNIELFFNKLDVEGLKTGKVKKLVAAGYDSIPQILRMTIHDFENIDGFGKKSALQLFNTIKEKVEQSSLIKIMVASNFARGMGNKKIGPIIESYPDILISDLTDNEKIKLLLHVKGIAENTAVRFVSNIKHFLDFLKDTGLEYKLNKVEEKIEVDIDKSHPLFGKKIIMTGFRDKDFEMKLNEIGVEIASSVSKNVLAVLVKDLEETTGKVEKALKLGIPLMTLDEFKLKYNLD